MGNTVSKLHTMFHRATLIIKHSHGRHTPVRIRLYTSINGLVHKDSKVLLKNKEIYDAKWKFLTSHKSRSKGNFDILKTTIYSFR